MLHIEIKQLKKMGFTVSQIAAQLKISRQTVYDYLKMSYEEAEEWVMTLSRRGKKLDPYQDWIVAWLKEYPHLSAAQIKDWLLEKFPSLEVGDSTVRLYVTSLREIHQIPKQIETRSHEAVPELPMGQQIQVDWGESKQQTRDGKSVKLYVMCFVLSHSRYKYMYWLNRPFRIQDMLEGHERAFAYFGGRTDEIIYDQDRLIAIDENAGDLILTQAFQTYVKERQFRVILCRKADPQSKGKIESVVKYVKYNFADSRIYSTLDNWNERALAWLERTGNHRIHDTTKKRPEEVFALEKQYLIPVSPLQSFDCISTPSITRNIRKDNTVLYQANRYSLPLGSYQSMPKNQVLIDIKESTLYLYHPQTKALIDSHPLASGKGQLIQKKSHKRDRSKSIESLKQTVYQQLSNDSFALTYVDQLMDQYPRYRRDQLTIVQRLLRQAPDVAIQAMHDCHELQLWSANDLKNRVTFLQHQHNLRRPDLIATLSTQSTEPTYHVSTREMGTYTAILEGRN